MQRNLEILKFCTRARGYSSSALTTNFLTIRFLEREILGSTVDITGISTCIPAAFCRDTAFTNFLPTLAFVFARWPRTRGVSRIVWCFTLGITVRCCGGGRGTFWGWYTGLCWRERLYTAETKDNCILIKLNLLSKISSSFLPGPHYFYLKRIIQKYMKKNNH